MYTINAWWAGEMVRHFTVSDLDAVEEALAKLQWDLRLQKITLYCHEVQMVVTTLCVDVIADEKLFQQHNFKAK